MPTEVSPNEHILREPGSLQLDPSGEGVAIDETKRLIASNKVEGTRVYKCDGEQLGNVYNFMVDKYTGQVAYAVMSFGGFLGLGESYHPLPWKVLTYDTRLEGYVIDLDRERLKNAPRYDAGEEPFADPAFGQRLGDYYGAR
jgi:PRC-barrel domain